MNRSRYREERTLVRGLHRLPGEDRASFKQKVARLREHFEQFNLDVAELCQWLMSLRPNGVDGVKPTAGFWESFLEPEKYANPADATSPDRLRRAILDAGMGECSAGELSQYGLPKNVTDSIDAVATLPRSTAATKMIARLRVLSHAHQMILAKAAAEFIGTRYIRAKDNSLRQREEWDKERAKWEQDHPSLTEAGRGEYNGIFEAIGIKDARPRVCSAEHLNKRLDNCQYAGERIHRSGLTQYHSPLCKLYWEFIDNLKRTSKTHEKYFVSNAQRYLKIRKERQGLTKAAAIQYALEDVPQARYWFPKAWDDYLKTLNLNEATILKDYAGQLPHCLKFDNGSECLHNPHTELCRQYRDSLSQLSPYCLELEPLYREWRRYYLKRPRQHEFRYPSSRSLPLPKIFGRDFFSVDFASSTVSLRLDDMPAGESLTFSFKPWPRDYDVQPDSVEITSAHAHFVGTRARVGFRFAIPHEESRIKMSQDEIDELRSRKYPRAAQDEDFLIAVRNRIRDSFAFPMEKELRVVAIDLGTAAGAACFFQGTQFVDAKPLKIVKIDRQYTARPEPGRGDTEVIAKVAAKARGLTALHIGRHLNDIAENASHITQSRTVPGQAVDSGLADHDMRRLVLHIQWMIRDWVRLNTAQIIDWAVKQDADLIVFESMRGFRLPGYDKLDDEKKRRLALFAHGRIRHKVAEKAVERGMRVVTVPYLYSSQFCSECGRRQEDRKAWELNKRKQLFRCENTNYKFECNSEENAARVLARVFWGSIQLPVKGTVSGC